MTVLVNLAVLLGMFVVIPAGLRLVDPDSVPLDRIARAWPLAGLAGGASLWLDRGPVAAWLAAGYAAATVLLAAFAAVRWLRRRWYAAAEIAVLTALVAPAVAGTALVAERAGYRLFGFTLEILALTVPHFHYAGFAAALIAGLVCRTVPGPAATIAALSVPAGTALVLVGYFVNDVTELAGAVVLTAGMWLVGWLTWSQIRPRGADRLTRAALGIAAGVLVVSMLLALNWAVGHVTDLPHLSLTWMAATHGIGNALGFGVCGVLAWHRLQRESR
ncbi:MAG: YndJ family protein [Micromonosporaceae bacterium]